MIYLWTYLGMLVGAACTLLAITAMRRREKHNVGTLGWLLLILLTPPIGLVLFVLLSGKKISAEHEQRDLVEIPPPEPNQVCNLAALVDGVRKPDAIHGNGFGGDGQAIANRLGHELASIGVRRGLQWPSDNNSFRLLTTPETIHRAFFDLIQSSRQRILVHSFILANDQVGNAIIDSLCEKARAGIEVCLLVDGFGSFFLPDKLLRRVFDAGGKAARFKPLSKLSRFAYSNFRNHRKMIIVDGRHAMIGGANWVEYEMTPTPDDETWADYAVRIDGIAAKQIEAIFLSDWAFATDDSIDCQVQTSNDPKDAAKVAFDKDAAILQVVPVGPDGPDEMLDDLWLTAINRAHNRVWVMTPYFVPPPMAMRSLAMAIRRGVDVRVVYPDESDIVPADYARHDYARDLHSLGATILRMSNKMLHSKMLIVDDQVAFVGSANFDMRSFFLNYELVVGVFNQPKIAELCDYYDQVSQACDKGPRPDHWVRRTLGVLTRVFAKEL